jgi:hypothetical protein
VNYPSASNADYATVEESGYKRGSNTNHFPQTQNVGLSEEASRPTNETSNIPVDDSAYASVLNSRSPKTKHKAEPVYAKVNKKKKRKVCSICLLLSYFLFRFKYNWQVK